jgi:TM2 domain-containing membrane protein YozV
MMTHGIFVGYALWLVTGLFGVHRFYFGKRASGVLYMLTLGVAGIGWLIDLFLIPSMRRASHGRFQAGRYSYSVGWFLLVFLGLFGAHRFYARKWWSGLLYLCTLGVLGLGFLYDLFAYNDVLSDTNETWISGTLPERKRWTWQRRVTA